MPVTEQDALRAMEAAKLAADDPARVAKAKGIVDAYRTEQSQLGKPLFPAYYQAKADDQKKVRSFFQDRDRHGLDDDQYKEVAQTLQDPEKKARFFNEQFLARTFNRPTQEIRKLGAQYRDEYALQAWGEPVKTEGEFYQKLGEDFDTEDQIADLAQTSALQGIPAVQAWAQVPDEIKTNPAFQRRQKALLAEFEETAAATDARISPYRQTVTQTIEDLRETMKGAPSDTEKAGAALSGGLSAMGAEAGREISGAMNFRDFAQRIVEIPKEDRDLVIAAIIAGAGEGGAKGPAQKLAENFARGVQDLASSVPAMVDRNALRQMASFVNQGAGVDGDATTVEGYLQGLNARIAAASDPTGAAALAAGVSEKTAPSEEIRKEAAALIETQMEAIDVANDLQQIADGVIDPAKGEYMVTRGLYGAARSIPYTLVAMAPGGIVLNTVALTEQSYQTIRRANPDMSRDDAMAISAIAGPIQAGLEQIPAAMLAGKLPTLGRFMNQAVATRGSVATRFAIRSLEGTAVEMIQENAQDLTPFAVQGTIEALSDDMPDVPWNEVYGGDFWNQQGELFFATLPLALIGAGAGTVRDFTAARSLMHDPRAVSSIIGNEAKASEIAEAAQSGNYNKAQSLLREGMREVKADRSDLMAVRQKAAAELQADATRKAETITKAEEAGVLPAIGRTAEGWSLKFNDGTARTFDNHQEADAARWRYTEEAGLSVAEATRSVIQSVESQLEAGREVAFSFVPERRTLLNAVQDGEVAPEAANKRAQIAQDVGGQQVDSGAQDAEIDPEQEYQEAFTAAELAAITEDDKLALFQILGSNKTEFADGVQRTTIKLFQGATPLTVIEEKLEGDASAMIAGGKRDWLLYSLIRYQRTSGDKVFREGVKSNDDISDADLKEAWSHLGQSYFVGRSRRGDVGDRWKSRNFRKAAAELLRSPVGVAMDGYARFFQSVWKRAAKLNKLRREGKLDAELERELARSVGFGEQAEYEASVEAEAAALLREMEDSEMAREPLGASTFEPTDDAPFSVVNTGGMGQNRAINSDSSASGENIAPGSQADIEARDVTYSEAIERGDENSAWRALVDTAKARGRVLGFHGTDASFSEWDFDAPRRTGTLFGVGWAWFSDNEKTASSYGKNVLRRFLNLQDPHEAFYNRKIVEFGKTEFNVRIERSWGNVWATDGREVIDFTSRDEAQKWIDEDSKDSPWTQHMLQNEANEAERKNSRSIIIKGIDDSLGSELLAPTDVYAVKDARQIESGELVIRDESGNIIPPSKRFASNDQSASEQSDASFSVITNAESRIAESFNPFLRNPEQRRRIVLEAQKRSAEAARGFQEIIRFNRPNTDIERERKERADMLFSEKLDTLSPAEIGALEMGEALTDPSMQPILSELLRRQERKTKTGKTVGYWKGSLMSKSAAQRQGIDTKGGEWNGIPEGLPPYVWGGSITPDTAAGMFGFERPEMFWDAISAEILGLRQRKEEAANANARIRELETEAKAESRVWADEQKKLRRTVGTDRATLIAAMRTLDAMISALPSEIRGKVGGFVRLAQFKTPSAMLDELERRANRLDTELERWLKKEADKGVKKLFERAKPAKDESGKKRVGKAGADIHDLFETARMAWKNWDAEKAEAHAVGIEAEVAKGELSPEWEAHKLLEAELVRSFGGWNQADSVRKNHALDTATEIWDRGYLEYREKKAKEKERRDGIRTELRADTGKAGKKSERALTEMAGVKLPGRARDFFLSLLNFEQLTQWAFGKESKWAQWFADEQRKAENTKLDAVQAVTEGIEDFFTELAGGNRFKGEQLQYRMMQRSLTAKAADGDIVPLSELEALSALLMWQQEDGKRHLRGKRDENGSITSTWAYDEDFIDEISGKLSPEAWRVLGYLQGEYAKEYGPLNSVYRDIYGINLPQNANYSPLTVKPTQAAAGQTADPLTGSTVSTGSFTPGSLRSRAQVSAEPDFRDAVATFIAHKKQIEHWKAHARFVLDANAVLGNREVGNSIEAAHGQEAVKIIRKWLDAIAQGGVRDASAGTAMRRFFDRITGNAASMALVGRVGTLAVQATQLGAAAALMPTGAYAVRLGKLLSGNLGWGTALSSPYIQRRLAQQPIMVQAAMEGLKAGKPTQIKHQVRKLGSMLNGADALFTAGTYAIAYDYHLKEAVRGGMDGAGAAAYATETAERVVESVAQPTRLGTRSYLEVSSSNPFMRLAWAFASDARKNVGLMGMAYTKGDLTDKYRAALFVVLLNGLLAGVIRSAWRDLRDDDETMDEKYWSAKRLALSTSTDWFTGFPVIGEEVQRAIMNASGEYTPDGGLLSALSQAPKAAANLIEGDSTSYLRDIEKLMTAIGLFSDNTAAFTSVMHLVRDIYGLGENFTGD